MKHGARIALATSAALPDLYADERALISRFAERGVDARAVVWSDPDVRWRDFDRVVLRSTWDYFERVDAFRAWLARLEAESVELVNPYALVRWNLDKGYLRDLEAKGIAVVPTVLVAKGEAVDLAGVLGARGWTDAVVKPTVSGGAYRTHRVEAHDAHLLQREVEATLRASGLLIQPFMREIADEGEWSLFFFDGAFSHAVLKQAARGDYRVQPQFGGTFRVVDPPAAMIAEARAVLDAMPGAARYARVDGVRREGSLCLMELEAIEPYLYLPGNPAAADRYVAAVARGLDARSA